MSLHSEMTSVTFKLKQKKCKPSLSPGVKTVWRRLQSINKNADPNTVSGQSRPDNPSATYVLNDSTKV